MKKSVANFLCAFIPSKKTRCKIRSKLVKKTKIEKLENSIEMLYFLIENCLGVQNLPKAIGKLRLIQEENLKILRFFGEFCKKNNLEYWLDFGTLLGAVRHKGFIPWDDDLDISMTRDNYEKLLNLPKEKLENDNYSFEIKAGNPKSHILKLLSKTTKAQLDIFPCNFYYKNIRTNEEKDIFHKNLEKAHNKYLEDFGYKVCDYKPNYSSSNIRNVINEIMLKNEIIDLSCKPSMFYGIEFHHGHGNKIIDFDTIFPLKTLDFEGSKFFVPNNCEKHLTFLYGDYMKIPRELALHKEIFGSAN